MTRPHPGTGISGQPGRRQARGTGRRLGLPSPLCPLPPAPRPPTAEPRFSSCTAAGGGHWAGERAAIGDLEGPLRPTAALHSPQHLTSPPRQGRRPSDRPPCQHLLPPTDNWFLSLLTWARSPHLGDARVLRQGPYAPGYLQLLPAALSNATKQYDTNLSAAGVLVMVTVLPLHSRQRPDVNSVSPPARLSSPGPFALVLLPYPQSKAQFACLVPSGKPCRGFWVKGGPRRAARREGRGISPPLQRS